MTVLWIQLTRGLSRFSIIINNPFNISNMTGKAMKRKRSLNYINIVKVVRIKIS